MRIEYIQSFQIDKNVTFTYSTSSSGNIINPIFNSNSYTKLEFTTTNASYGSPSIYLKLTDNQNILFSYQF